MNDDMQGGRGEGGGIGGWFARLRENETLMRLSRGRPDLLIFGAPVVAIAIVVGAVVAGVALAGGGGDDGAQAIGSSPTAEATDVLEPSATPAGSAGLKTPIAVSPGELLTLSDLAQRGSGVPPRGPFTGSRLRIPTIGVDAPFTYKMVPPDGQMPNPNGPEDVAYYDFAQHPGLGGLPAAGGNVVVAGHVDYIRYGPAVFWDVPKLVPGDRVQIEMQDGSVIEYAIEFNKRIDADAADWTAVVAATAEESITLITCVGQFSAGQYSDRQIAWGRRVT